jgi:hypothetical protein
MASARTFVAVLILVGAALAACSGNFGSGTTPPNGLLPSGNLAGINPTPSPTPNSASNIVTYGSSTEFQPLPAAGGYGGAIAFPVPSPKPSGFTDIAVGATISVVRPDGVPDLNLATKGTKGTKRERPARQLVYLTLLPTHDMTLESYPRIAIDVPRDIVTVYRVSELGLALYNSGAKDTTFRLAAAELDTATPPPTPTPNPSAPPPPTAIPVSASAVPSGRATASPTATATASASPLPSGVTPGPSGAPGSSAAPAASPTLPPQRIVFAGTATTLKLTANRPVVFALYALPVATPAPSPRASGASTSAAAPEASGSAAPAASGSAAPVASGSPVAGASAPSTAAPSPSPART